jgi:PadR family transcriptional regulator PadR
VSPHNRPPTPADTAMEAMLAEWKRGMLTFWALALVAQRPWYGLEISKHIEHSTQGELTLGVSTMYPLLRRLEARGLASRRWERTTEGPPRAYYTATAAGRQVLTRYVRSVLSPGSPINRALGKLLRDLAPALRPSA